MNTHIEDRATDHGRGLSSCGQLCHLTEKELAQRWSVAVKTLQNQRVAGCGLSYLKIGRSVRYRLIDVIAFEEGARRMSTSEGGTHG